MTGGLRRYHEQHGEPVDELRVTMPVSIRKPGDPVGGNRITLLRFTVPVSLTDAGEQVKRRSRAENDEAVEAMKKRGLTVHPVPPDAEMEWRKLGEEVQPKIRGNIVPADLFDEVVKVLKEYRASPKSGA